MQIMKLQVSSYGNLSTVRCIPNEHAPSTTVGYSDQANCRMSSRRSSEIRKHALKTTTPTLKKEAQARMLLCASAAVNDFPSFITRKRSEIFPP